MRDFQPGQRSVEQTLEETLEDVRSGEADLSGVLVIGMNNRTGGYDVLLRRGGGVTCSEGIALLHIAQALLREQMGF